MTRNRQPHPSAHRAPLIEGMPFVIDQRAATADELPGEIVAVIAGALAAVETEPQAITAWGLEGRREAQRMSNGT